MLLGRVIGTLTPCVIYKGLEGVPMLWVQPLDKEGNPRGEPFVACDSTRAEWNAAERLWMEEELSELGFEVADSQANFCWIALGELEEADEALFLGELRGLAREGDWMNCAGNDLLALPRKPAFNKTGAIVLRMIACSSGSVLISRSARLTAAASVLDASVRK